MHVCTFGTAQKSNHNKVTHTDCVKCVADVGCPLPPRVELVFGPTRVFDSNRHGRVALVKPHSLTGSSRTVSVCSKGKVAPSLKTIVLNLMLPCPCLSVCLCLCLALALSLFPTTRAQGWYWITYHCRRLSGVYGKRCRCLRVPCEVTLRHGMHGGVC